jgi:hypothetical protein
VVPRAARLRAAQTTVSRPWVATEAVSLDPTVAEAHQLATLISTTVGVPQTCETTSGIC